LARSSLATHLPPASHCAINSTSLKISAIVTFGGGRPISWTHQTLPIPYEIYDLQATISFVGMCTHSLCSVLHMWDIVCVEQMGHPQHPLVANPT
jgi:hypothetical protein